MLIIDKEKIQKFSLKFFLLNRNENMKKLKKIYVPYNGQYKLEMIVSELNNVRNVDKFKLIDFLVMEFSGFLI